MYTKPISLAEDEKQQILLLLKTNFPEFERKLGLIYTNDSLFREIAKEYYEIVKKMEMNYFETGKKFDYYIDGINELKEELMDYLNDLKW